MIYVETFTPSLPLLVFSGVAVAIVALIAAYRWRGSFVPVHWTAFFAMALGSVGIALFYVFVSTNTDHDLRIFVSRLIFLFILASTLLMSIGALLIQREDLHG